MKDVASIFQDARQLAELLASSLPDRVQAAAMTLNSKLPFKALSIREVLLHRTSSLATPAVELYDRDQIIPAAVLTRAVVETTAVLYTLHMRLSRFLAEQNVQELDDFLMRCLIGARNQPGFREAINVLTFIDHVDKAIPGYRSSYDNLCEYTHPNWAGTLGSFGKLDKEQFELVLGPSNRTAVKVEAVFSLSGALMIFHHYYNDSASLVRQMNDFFEHGKSV